MARCLIYTDIESVAKRLKCFLCFDNCGVDGADQNFIKDRTDANGMLTPTIPLFTAAHDMPIPLAITSAFAESVSTSDRSFGLYGV